jgi:hypothetical protein
MSCLPAGTAVAFVHVGDRDRAMSFYCGTLGLEPGSSDDFGDFIDLGCALLRMTVIPDHKAHAHPVLGWNVPDIRAAVETLRDRGIEFTNYKASGRTLSASGRRRTARRKSPSSPIRTATC